MTAPNHPIVVEYTTIKIDGRTEYVVFCDVIQLIVDQGAPSVEEVTTIMIEQVARIILENGPRPACDMLEELYMYSLCKLGFVPVQLSMVSAKLCASRHQVYVRRLAEHAKQYKLITPSLTMEVAG